MDNYPNEAQAKKEQIIQELSDILNHYYNEHDLDVPDIIGCMEIARFYFMMGCHAKMVNCFRNADDESRGVVV